MYKALSNKKTGLGDNARTILVFLVLLVLLIVANTEQAQAAVNYLLTSTPTKTITPSPTVTSKTPSRTSTPAASPTDTPTTTLVPLPALTLIFPVATSSPTAVIPSAVVSMDVTVTPQGEAKISSLSPRFQLLTLLLVLLWLFLIGFVILYIHQLK